MANYPYGESTRYGEDDYEHYRRNRERSARGLRNDGYVSDGCGGYVSKNGFDHVYINSDGSIEHGM